jgi:predicted RNase H-like nuclease (RuvC/YqgF family)
MSDMTIRDPDAMEKFANEIEVYCDAMKRVCNELKSNLSSASPMMKDEKSRRAIQKIERLADDLISGLPEARNAADKLKEAAKPLKQARSISI